ncbi:hypothetical protein H8958_022749 [Nasalis larvatus]
MSRAWSWAPVILATLEAEVGELLEPRRRRLRWAEIAPLHSILGDRMRLCLKKKNRCPLPSFRAHPCITCGQYPSSHVRVRAYDLLLILIIKVV